MNRPLYNIEAARSASQANEMRTLEEQGYCFMCHLDERKIFASTRTMNLMLNDYPYRGTKEHLLIVPKRHITDMSEMTDEELLEHGQMIQQAVKMFKHESYSTFTRNGDFRYNGGSVSHLHTHVIIPDTTKPDKVKVKLISSPMQPKDYEVKVVKLYEE